ncbi:MAG: FHA domain-containing protein [Bacteroidales bacterium]|nr:FHA domain-containing protein [Bacteroidales bacterium]
MIEFTVGRESGTEMPRLAIVKDGKTFYFGTPGSVPKGVSRLHCKVIVDDEASITTENVTENNLMYVNGVDCRIKRNLGLDDTIELGSCRYRLELETIVKALASNQSFSISHLEQIYQSYEDEKLDYQMKQSKLGLWGRIPSILMLSIGFIAFLFSGQSLRIIISIVAVLIAIVLYALTSIMMKKNNPRVMKQRDDAFREQYVCPNPSCRRFLGFTPYNELLRNGSCPYCRAKFEE